MLITMQNGFQLRVFSGFLLILLLISKLTFAEEVAVRLGFQKKPLKTLSTKLARNPSLRGWDYLVTKLAADNINPYILRKVYSSRRMPRFKPVEFKLKPREKAAVYSSVTNKKNLGKARAYLKKHKRTFHRVWQHFKVNPYVITAILLIETRFGTATGRSSVLHRLSRMASAADPDNIEHNYRKLKKEDPAVTLNDVRKRALELEEMFYPEIPALFEIAQKRKIDIFRIKGSYAGAFGIPQFLPTSYLKFGYDGNKDGIISLFNEIDAIWSVANYLSSYGWKDSAPLTLQKKVIWHYNHSQPYVDTVIKVAELLKNY
ncbi:MAG: hypothetical protein D6719_02880 [Candidatus Dadabacteria bacterium]|nr:MAG: hypothetical protein D6719_02880 [Candidatus Dadabacteria bacterium]